MKAVQADLRDAQDRELTRLEGLLDQTDRALLAIVCSHSATRDEGRSIAARWPRKPDRALLRRLGNSAGAYRELRAHVSARSQLAMGHAQAHRRLLRGRGWLDPDEALQVLVVGTLMAIDGFPIGAHYSLGSAVHFSVLDELKAARRKLPVVRGPQKGKAPTMVWLDAPIATADGDACLLDLMTAPEAERVDPLLSRHVQDALTVLKQREIEVLTRRACGETCQEIGGSWQMSRQAASLIELAALGKMRRKLKPFAAEA